MPNDFYAAVESTPLSIRFNPEGGGLMLCVPRGISCEGHTQVFSGHCTNTPDEGDVTAELEEYARHYAKQWDAFVGLMQAMCEPDFKPGNQIRSTDWATKDAISAVFCNWLVRRIAHESEKRWEKRHR